MCQCRAAMRWAMGAVLISLVALAMSTWFIPGLIKSLNRLSDRLERMDDVSRTAGRD
jgi:hypothetical protein